MLTSKIIDLTEEEIPWLGQK